MRPALLTAVAATTLSGCNFYDWFLIAGYQQEGFSNKADIVFVIDNSGSMDDEAEALATNFSSFIDVFAGDAPPITDPTLADDLGRYLEYVEDRTNNVNFQVGITTTDLPRSGGRLLGDNPVLARNDEDVPTKFIENLLCYAACLPGGTSVPVECPGGIRPSDRTCADPKTSQSEEGIEAVFMAMCRAVDDPPEACFQTWYPWFEFREMDGIFVDTIVEYKSVPQPDAPNGESPPSVEPIAYFGDEDILSNEGWLRDNSVVIPVIVTDEGDQSRRIEGRQGDAFPYPNLFSEFGRRMTWAVIGADPVECAGFAREWGINRYKGLVESTNGVYVNIAEEVGGTCEVSDFDAALTRIGNLLRGLADTFPLKRQPVFDSIIVEVNGVNIPPAEGRFDADLGLTVYDDGWVYVPDQNAVVLKGDAVPDFNADVFVWYLPASEVPRELPF